MFYLDQETLKRYRIGTPFVYGETQYTSAGACHDTFIKLGFKQVIPAPAPDPAFYVVNTPCNPDGSWTYTERPLDQVQQRYCAQQLEAAQHNLQSTDYMYARALEETTKRSGEMVPVPSAVVGQRDAVRLTCKSNCAIIMSAADIEALEMIVKAPHLVVEDPSLPPDEWEMVTNPQPHLEPLPTIELSAYLTPELI